MNLFRLLFLVHSCFGSNFYKKIFSRDPKDTGSVLSEISLSGNDEIDLECVLECRRHFACGGFEKNGNTCYLYDKNFEPEFGGNTTLWMNPDYFTPDVSFTNPDCAITIAGNSQTMSWPLEMNIPPVDDCSADCTEDRSNGVIFFENKIYTCGGYITGGIVKTCHILGSDRIWRPGPTMVYGRALFFLFEMKNRIVAVGGSIINAYEILEGNTWRAGTQPHSLWGTCCVPISENEILMMGGTDGNFPYNSVKLINIDTDTSTPRNPLLQGAQQMACINVEDTVIIAAGYTSGWAATDKVFQLNIVTDEWTQIGTLTENSTPILKGDSSFIKIHGIPYLKFYDSIYLYNLEDKARTMMTSAIHGSRAVVVRCNW